MSPLQTYQHHDKDKDAYNQGVINIKKIFQPLLFTVSDRMVSELNAPRLPKEWLKR